MAIDFSSPAELRRMTPSELRKELSVKRAEAAKMRLGLTMQKEKNSALYRRIKREVACILLILCEMQRAGKTDATEMPEKSSSQPTKKSVKRSSSVSKRKKAA